MAHCLSRNDIILSERTLTLEGTGSLSSLRQTICPRPVTVIVTVNDCFNSFGHTMLHKIPTRIPLQRCPPILKLNAHDESRTVVRPDDSKQS